MDIPRRAAPERNPMDLARLFAVRREVLQQHPRGFYERLLHRFEQINHSNPEEAHFMERFWLALLHVDPMRGPW